MHKYIPHSFRKGCKTDFGSNIKIFYTWVPELKTQVKGSQKTVSALQNRSTQ